MSQKRKASDAMIEEPSSKQLKVEEASVVENGEVSELLKMEKAIEEHLETALKYQPVSEDWKRKKFHLSYEDVCHVEQIDCYDTPKIIPGECLTRLQYLVLMAIFRKIESVQDHVGRNVDLPSLMFSWFEKMLPSKEDQDDDASSSPYMYEPSNFGCLRNKLVDRDFYDETIYVSYSEVVC